MDRRRIRHKRGAGNGPDAVGKNVFAGERMRAIHLDCGFGLGGDMFLAALADLEARLNENDGGFVAGLEAALRRAGLEVSVSCPVTRKNGLAGRRLVLEHANGQPLRHLPDILAIVERMGLDAALAARLVRAFTRLAEVEAGVHGIAVGQVHFHEVGAVDTVVDVAGAFKGLRALGVERVTAGPLPWFAGMVDCAHGRLPLPAPATLELLRGKPVYPTKIRREIITPTGALILDQAVDAFGPGPEGVILGSGTGWGNLDLGPGCTGLRAILYEMAE